MKGHYLGLLVLGFARMTQNWPHGILKVIACVRYFAQTLKLCLCSIENYCTCKSMTNFSMQNVKQTTEEL